MDHLGGQHKGELTLPMPTLAGGACYICECKECQGQTYLTEPEFLEMTGKELKEAIDSGNSSKAQLLLLTRKRTPTSGMVVTGAGGNTSEALFPTITCGGCEKVQLPLTSFKRKKLSDKSDPRNMTAAAEVIRVMEEEEDAITRSSMAPEVDPLMLALMKVRKDLPGQNHWHGETGTMRISHTLRWLIGPTMGVVRVLLQKYADIDFVGSVSVFRQRGGKSAARSLGFLQTQVGKLMPLTIAADAPISLLVTLLIMSLFTILIAIIFYCSSWGQDSDHSDYEKLWTFFNGGAWVTLAYLMKWMPLVIFIDGPLLANLFMYWTICRDPGYQVPSPERLREMKAFVETRGSSEEPPSTAGSASADSAGALEQQVQESRSAAKHDKASTIDFGMISQALGVAAAAPVVAGAAALAGAAGSESSPLVPASPPAQQSGAAAAAAKAAKGKTEEEIKELEDLIKESEHEDYANPFGDRAGAGDGWSWCKICCIKRPPRTYHCKVCNLCVLEHDHHCVVIGSCVGRRNTVLFYCFLATASSATLLTGLTAGLYCLGTAMAGHPVSYVGWILLIVEVVVCTVLVIWIGMLYMRHSHSFRTDKTTREQIQILVKAKRDKQAGKELKAEDFSCLGMFPGRPSPEEAKKNHTMILARPIPKSNFDQTAREDETVI